MMHWWMKKGADGFRMDVVGLQCASTELTVRSTSLQKHPDYLTRPSSMTGRINALVRSQSTGLRYMTT